MGKTRGRLIVLICCFLLVELLSCEGQLILRSHLNEYLGRSSSYRVPGGKTRAIAACKRDPVKPLSYLPFQKASVYMSCFLQMAKRGGIPKHPDHGKRADQVILDHGYSLVTYNNVTSKDGYIQTMFRITGSPSSPPRKGKPAVLLFHGTSGSADLWLLLDDRSPAFNFANAGYEVWIVNARGTDYSLGHVKWDSNRDLEFWNFSYHEMAVQDVPVYIDLMLSETGTKKIFFVGYSMGAAIFLASLAERPELNDKIYAGFLLGTMAFSAHTTTKVRMIAVLVDLPPVFQELLNVAYRGRVVIGSPVRNHVLYRFCSDTVLGCGMCANSLVAVDFQQVSPTFLTYAASRTLNTFPFKEAIHHSQNLRSCRLNKFDYGPKRNIELYGQPAPPAYNLSNVRTPTYFYYGEGDDYAAVEDLKLLTEELPPGTVKGFRRINWKYFNHFDFVVAKDGDILVYDRIIDDMKQYIM